LVLGIASKVFAKIFGIAGFLLALIGGALIAYSALTASGHSITELATRGIDALLGLGAIVAGIMMYTGPMRFGGMLAVLGGIILLVLTSFATPAILVFAGGILGIIGAAVKPAWWKFWKR